MPEFQPEIRNVTFLFQLSIFSSLTLLIMAISPLCSGNDSGPVTPTTPLLSFLERLQETALETFGPVNFDPKIYVDLPLKFDLSTTEQAFDNLPRTQNGAVSVKELELFIKKYFYGAGDDLVYVEPVDFVAEPDGFLPKVKNQEARKWALEVHSLWKILSRRVSEAVKERPERHTLLFLPEPVIIPGSRFREVYYWDSYWIIRGLLVSKMYDSAKAIVINLISLVEEYGFVLNGARSYYTNRSQPPLLSSMVHELYKRTRDVCFVKRCLPALLTEFRFWNSGMHKVKIRDSRAREHTLSRYYAMWNKPRPESSTIDKESASKLSNTEKEHFYRELASSAESGWDFSTRWMRNSSDLTTLVTTSILPVDLNAFILKMELDIAFLAKVAGEEETAEHFLEASRARKKAFNSIFWNEEKGQWLDCWINNSPICSEDITRWETWHQNRNVFASNFIPLWIELLHSGHKLKKAMRSLETSGLLCAAGIASSLTNSGQQWDFPNGWAPLQHMVIEGLVKSGSEKARLMAERIAVRWLRTNYAAYKKTGLMYEKYDVENCGESGDGGEYRPQTGFGWTNGVVLALLEEFGWPYDLKLDCE
ncbi:hypothetical protein Nepgr_011153 [Nepenthes gracilis]|uniref:Trehalase n=1 Tax=Nepenthes gracilis TaxID=150966 RepID=A0AAD3XLQ2_NEPGR|nr:hypothetical protein Nepgr_011153 [Nepenthes gracilis]